jgi:hypothetical protein
MKKEVKDIIRSSIGDLLKACKANYVDSEEYGVIYKVTAPNGWRMEQVVRKPLHQTFHKVDVKKITSPAEEAFLECYPEYKTNVGLSIWGGASSFMLGNVIREIVQIYWSKHRTLDLNVDHVEIFVSDIECFIDSEEIEINVITPLEYLSTDVFLPDLKIGNVILRRFTDDEITGYLGGTKVREYRLPIYCLDLPSKAKKIFNATDSGEIKNAVEKLDFAVDALRTFKSGRIGRGTIFFDSRRYLPLIGGSSFLNVKNLNWSSLTLNENEIASFKEHCDYLLGVTNKALKIAYGRLSNSEVGRDAYDSFLDAMIGLESLLAPDNEQEIKYRFSMRYASFFEDPKERFDNYKIARSLYDLRSAIVHGNIYENTFKKMSIDQWAKMAREMLRMVLKKFIRENPLPYERDDKYWEKKTLRIPDNVVLEKTD